MVTCDSCQSLDLFDIALNLDYGRSENILCRSCSIRSIYKDESGRIYIAEVVRGDVQMRLVRIEEL